MKLYEINREYITALLDCVDTETGEITNQDALESLEMTLVDKALNTAKVIKNFQSDVDALKAEEKKLADRRRVLENRVEWLKNYLSINIPKGINFADAQAEIRWRKSESVEVADPNFLPIEYRRVKVEADKTAIKKALKAGESVEGATLLLSNKVVIK